MAQDVFIVQDFLVVEDVRTPLRPRRSGSRASAAGRGQFS